LQKVPDVFSGLSGEQRGPLRRAGQTFLGIFLSEASVSRSATVKRGLFANSFARRAGNYIGCENSLSVCSITSFVSKGNFSFLTKTVLGQEAERKFFSAKILKKLLL